jgi:peptidoglycan lytic transglycosylase
LPPQLATKRTLVLHCNNHEWNIMTFKKMRRSAATLAVVLAAAASPATASECGSASWYALTSTTASGEKMNPEKLTAAHRKLPFGSKIHVTNTRNGKTVVVRINDRGPFIKGRIIDLSKAAAREIGMVRAGHSKVCLRVVS